MNSILHASFNKNKATMTLDKLRASRKKKNLITEKPIKKRNERSQKRIKKQIFAWNHHISRVGKSKEIEKLTFVTRNALANGLCRNNGEIYKHRSGWRFLHVEKTGK